MVVAQTIPLDLTNIGSPAVLTAVGLVLFGLAIRSWSAANLRKIREITTSGPYALIRNPLYVGSFMMMIGFCILCLDTRMLAVVCGPLALLYWGQIQLEEDLLRRMFPGAWERYSQQTRRFLPLRPPAGNLLAWSTNNWIANKEYRALLASACGLLAVFIWHAFVTM